MHNAPDNIARTLLIAYLQPLTEVLAGQREPHQLTDRATRHVVQILQSRPRRQQDAAVLPPHVQGANGKLEIAATLRLGDSYHGAALTITEHDGAKRIMRIESDLL